MKTARELADAFCARHVATMGYRDAVDSLTEAFRGYARNQRHACAQQVAGVESADGGVIVEACHAACLNTPFPGERAGKA